MQGKRSELGRRADFAESVLLSPHDKGHGPATGAGRRVSGLKAISSRSCEIPPFLQRVLYELHILMMPTASAVGLTYEIGEFQCCKKLRESTVSPDLLFLRWGN